MTSHFIVMRRTKGVPFVLRHLPTQPRRRAGRAAHGWHPCTFLPSAWPPGQPDSACAAGHNH